MIGRLTGRIVDCTPGRVLLDVGGVGYEVHISLMTFYSLSAAADSSACLHVHTHVREDALQLFGFFSLPERRTFEQLIGISGVGPKLALAILSGIGVEDLVQAIVRQDRARLQKIPGVGKKTAERLLLELRDKVAALAASDPGQKGRAPAGGPTGLTEDAVSALVNLGYSRAIAERAVETSGAPDGSPTTLEAVLKRALGKLAR